MDATYLKRRFTGLGAAAFLFLLPAALHAQAFDSGSDGRDGDLIAPDGATLDVPPDGIFRFRTVMVGSQSSHTRLDFRPNALNTPIYILATGDITFISAFSIDVSGGTGTSNVPVGGRGGPGGFDGGQPGVQNIPPGDGSGPGGGAAGETSAGSASYGGTPQIASAADGTPYGSPLLIPLVGGSGGGGTAPDDNLFHGGGGGGGAILLASNTRIVLNGEIFAQGGSTNDTPNTTAGGMGSGGAVRLVAPVVAIPNGTITVQGGTNRAGQLGARGRVRIDTLDRTQITSLEVRPTEALSIGTFMAVFPPVVPTLDVIEVAGRAIAPGAPAEIILPFGSSPNQTVKVRVSNFNGTVPIDVVLVPDSGPRSVVPTQVSTTGDPTDVTVNVTFPINNRTRVEVWTG